MSSISQTIPSYVAGISEQPDQLKLSGQVKDCVNALPDVTRMLGKRPGLWFYVKTQELMHTWVNGLTFIVILTSSTLVLSRQMVQLMCSVLSLHHCVTMMTVVLQYSAGIMWSLLMLVLVLLLVLPTM